MGQSATHQGLGARANAFVASIALLVGACGTEGSDSASTNPSRDLPSIVSLNPCLDAILVEVADPQQILALSHYSRDPASSSIDEGVAKQYEITGGTAEEIIALGPDLVLASDFLAPATKAALERLDISVQTFGSPATLDESLEQIERLASLAGQKQAGRALEQRIMRAVPVFNDVGLNNAGLAQTRSPSAMLWQPGQIVAGETSLVWEHLGRFGFANHSAQMGLSQADHVSLEAILSNPPDLLLIAGNSDGQTHPMLEEIKETRVGRFEPNLFYCGGPSIPKAWQRLEDIRLDYLLNPPGSEGEGHSGHAH
ncbi:MAG: ABC transporter substrate-binding protein [Pseudomonadota bacterium]